MDIQPLEILKWIGIALAAGFVGYFGRYPAKLLMRKLQKKKNQTHDEETAAETAVGHDISIEKSRLKLEKKKAKIEAKKAKKAGNK